MDIMNLVYWWSNNSSCDTFEHATSEANGMISTYEDTHPKLAEFLMNNLYDASVFLTFPKNSSFFPQSVRSII